jgi:hypothetical protein
MLSISLIGSVKSNADDQVIRLEKGTPSPYTGVLMPDSIAKDLRDAVVDRDGCKLINESLNKSIEFYRENESLNQEKVNILLQKNNELAESLRDTKDFNNTQRLIWFVLGIVVTGIAVYGVKQISNK